MNDVLIPSLVFVAILAITSLICWWALRPQYPRHCIYCGKRLRRGPWQIVGYSGTTGKPAQWIRYVWCETPAPEYNTPRPPPPLPPDFGRHIDDPDDPTFKRSHNSVIELRRF